MILKLSPRLIEQTRILYDDMEKAYDMVAERLGLSCTGCPDNCCDSYFLHHTYLEWAYLWFGLERLSPVKKDELRDRAFRYEDEARKCLVQGIRPRLMCPLNEDGRCSLYRYRLMVCRTHGVPATMRRPDGKELSFPGCFVCQEIVEKKEHVDTIAEVMDRTVLLERMVVLEQTLLQGCRHLAPKVRMTIAGMLLSGPPTVPRGCEEKTGRGGVC